MFEDVDEVLGAMKRFLSWNNEPGPDMQTSNGSTKQVLYYHSVLYLWVVPSSIVLLLEYLPISSSQSVESIFLLNTDVSLVFV